MIRLGVVFVLGRLLFIPNLYQKHYLRNITAQYKTDTVLRTIDTN